MTLPGCGCFKMPSSTSHSAGALRQNTNCPGTLKSAFRKTLRKKRKLLLNWLRADGMLSSSTVESFNNKLKLITRKSHGFQTQEAYEPALHHNLGALPEPEFTHRFF